MFLSLSYLCKLGCSHDIRANFPRKMNFTSAWGRSSLFPMLIFAIISSPILLEALGRIISQINSQPAILHELFHARKVKESLERGYISVSLKWTSGLWWLMISLQIVWFLSLIFLAKYLARRHFLLEWRDCVPAPQYIAPIGVDFRPPRALRKIAWRAVSSFFSRHFLADPYINDP